MKSDNQKARLFAIYQILKKYTDETHGLSMREILHHLEKDYDIHTTRQTVTSDFALLEYPLNIELDSTFDTPQRHFLSSRILEHEDILTVMESIQYNPRLKPQEKKRIINTIKENICSIHESKEISIKTSTYENFHTQNTDKATQDILSQLDRYIEDSQIINFSYPLFRFADVMNILPKIPNSKRHDVKYILSKVKYKFNGTSIARINHEFILLPLFTFCQNNKWYLCAKNADGVFPPLGIQHSHQFSGSCLFFEVDKIFDLAAKTHVRKRPIPDTEELFELARTTKLTPIYKSYLQDVLIDFDKELSPLVYDYFGKDVEIVKETDTQIRITAKAEISPEFYGWIFSLGTGAKVRSPQNVIRHMRKWIKALQGVYATPKNF